MAKRASSSKAKPRRPRASSRPALWVVKAGSEMVVGGGPLLIRHWMQQVAELVRERRIRVVWVTSGAIAYARRETRRSWSKLPEKQALSAIGQPMVMDAYNLALRTLGLAGAQVLLTNDDMSDAKRSRNLKNSLGALLAWDCVPVLNENDAVATEEIQFGDNDSLSARVAAMMRADRLVILTDVQGVYDSDPKTNRDARLIEEIPPPGSGRTRSEILRRIDASGRSRYGSGGMASKIGAALRAQAAGVPTHLIKGDEPGGLVRLAAGERVGTAFPAKKRGKR